MSEVPRGVPPVGGGPDTSSLKGKVPSGVPPVGGVPESTSVGAVSSEVPPVGGVPDPSRQVGEIPRGVPQSVESQSAQLSMVRFPEVFLQLVECQRVYPPVKGVSA